jgi:hypothetical protein
MGRSRHRDAVPAPMRVVITALAVSSALALVLVVVGSGAPLRLGLVLCLAVAVGAGVVAITSGRRSVSLARAEVSRERAARVREVELLRQRILEVQDAGRALSVRLDRENAQLAGLRADVSRWQRPTEVLRPTLVMPLLQEAIRRSAPVPLARVHVPLDDAAALASALAPRTEDRATGDRATEDRATEPFVEVLGEFSLIGLAAFPRPAGMPDPGLPLVAPVRVVDLTESTTIDLRAAESTVEQAGA